VAAASSSGDGGVSGGGGGRPGARVTGPRGAPKKRVETANVANGARARGPVEKYINETLLNQ